MAKVKLSAMEKELRYQQAEAVRTIRSRYAAALEAGLSTKEAAAFAHGDAPLISLPMKPAPQLPEPEVGPVRVGDIKQASVVKRAPKPVAQEIMVDGRVSNPIMENMPPNWQELPWPQLKKMTSELTGSNAASRKDAISKVEQFLVQNSEG